MPEFRKRFEDAWSQALVSVNAAEQEAEKIVARFAEAAGFGPEDVRRNARELGERLRAQRLEIERTIDDAVRRLTHPLRQMPSPGEIDGLRRRVDAIAERLERIERARDRTGAASADQPHP